MSEEWHADLCIKDIAQGFFLGVMINQVNIFTAGMENILLSIKDLVQKFTQIQCCSIQQVDIVIDIDLKNTKFWPQGVYLNEFCIQAIDRILIHKIQDMI